MRIPLVLLGYLLAVYFFAAAIAPRVRIRWGYARSWLWSRSGKTKVRYRQPKMGILSCLGTGVTLAAFSTVFLDFANDSVTTITFAILIVGFICAIVGQMMDRGGNGGGAWKKY